MASLCRSHYFAPPDVLGGCYIGIANSVDIFAVGVVFFLYRSRHEVVLVIFIALSFAAVFFLSPSQTLAQPSLAHRRSSYEPGGAFQLECGALYQSKPWCPSRYETRRAAAHSQIHECKKPFVVLRAEMKNKSSCVLHRPRAKRLRVWAFLRSRQLIHPGSTSAARPMRLGPVALVHALAVSPQCVRSR